MTSDITKLKLWFQEYLISEEPPKSGGYHEDVTHDGSDEDKPKGIIIKGHADPSIAEDICCALGINGHDLLRFSKAFEKLEELTRPFTYRNALTLRFSVPFQTAILTLLELEDYAKRVAENDYDNGSYVPETNLIEYMDKTRL